MLPRILLRKLGRLRLWEASLRLLWGVSRWAALAVALLALACLTDFAVDRFYETPWPLRVALAAGQVAVAVTAVVLLLLRPLFTGLGNTRLALLVEDRFPALHSRLISVLQFHRRGADLAGMSPELIRKVTDEAQRQAAGMRFSSVADKRRLGWSLAVVAPAALLAALPFVLWPELAQVLLARQALRDVDIPRSVHIEPDNATVYPKGEEVVLRFRVKGPGWAKDSVGKLRVAPDGQRAEYFPLEYQSRAGAGEAVFAATLPAGYPDLTYYAWLEDGRMKDSAGLRFEPRPVVQEIQGWALLPEFCGLRPGSGLPYEIEQPNGVIETIFGSSARVRVRVQKPVKGATLQLLGPALGFESAAAAVAAVALSAAPAQVGALAAAVREDTVLGTVPMTLDPDKTGAEAVFPLPGAATGYRVLVADGYGFKNIPAPRRTINLFPEPKPRVDLLPEQFLPDGPFAALAPAEDFQVEGMPVPPGGQIRIAYTCSHPYGLGGAQLRFRVFKNEPTTSAGSDVLVDDAPWLSLPLTEVKAADGSGAFDLRRGAFEGSPEGEQIQFHAVESVNPGKSPGRKEGGGRFDFNTSRLPGDNGDFFGLEPGDQIEFYVEVFAGQGADPGRPSGRSPSRLKTVVSVPELVDWIEQSLQEERRIRSLERRQDEVFGLP